MTTLSELFEDVSLVDRFIEEHWDELYVDLKPYAIIKSFPFLAADTNVSYYFFTGDSENPTCKTIKISDLETLVIRSAKIVAGWQFNPVKINGIERSEAFLKEIRSNRERLCGTYCRQEDWIRIKVRPDIKFISNLVFYQPERECEVNVEIDESGFFNIPFNQGIWDSLIQDSETYIQVDEQKGHYLMGWNNANHA